MHEADILYVDIEFLSPRVEAASNFFADLLSGFQQLVGIVFMGNGIHCATMVLKIYWPMELKTFFS